MMMKWIELILMFARKKKRSKQNYTKENTVNSKNIKDFSQFYVHI